MKKKTSSAKRVSTARSKKAAPNRAVFPPTDMFTAADLAAGSAMPMRLTLTVNIHPSGPVSNDPRAGTHSHRREEALHARLGRGGPKFLAWARRSSENADLLLADPIAAMNKAGIQLSSDAQRVVVEHFETLSSGEVLPAGVELVGMNVKIASEPYSPRKVSEPDSRNVEAVRLTKKRKQSRRSK